MKFANQRSDCPRDYKNGCQSNKGAVHTPLNKSSECKLIVTIMQTVTQKEAAISLNCLTSSISKFLKLRGLNHKKMKLIQLFAGAIPEHAEIIARNVDVRCVLPIFGVYYTKIQDPSLLIQQYLDLYYLLNNQFVNYSTQCDREIANNNFFKKACFIAAICSTQTRIDAAQLLNVSLDKLSQFIQAENIEDLLINNPISLPRIDEPESALGPLNDSSIPIPNDQLAQSTTTPDFILSLLQSGSSNAPTNTAHDSTISSQNYYGNSTSVFFKIVDDGLGSGYDGECLNFEIGNNELDFGTDVFKL